MTSHVIIALLVLSIILVLYSIAQNIALACDISKLRDKIGFGVSVPIGKIPDVLESIHRRVELQAPKQRLHRKDHRDSELLADLSQLDDSTA